PRARHDVGHPPDSRELLFDPLETADRKIELLPDGAVGARDPRRKLRRSGRKPREREPATRGEVRHEHLPALPDARPAAYDGIERNEYVPPVRRSVQERHAERIVAFPDFDAREVRRYEGEGDAQIFLVAEEMVGIVEAERQADQRRHGGERDVALPPVEPHAEDFPPPVLPAAYN